MRDQRWPSEVANDMGHEEATIGRGRKTQKKGKLQGVSETKHNDCEGEERNCKD